MSVKLGLYKHYRTKKLYQVIGVARHSETLEPLVVYQALYDSYGLWVRPADMFSEKVDDNGAMVDRFSYCGAGVCELARLRD